MNYCEEDGLYANKLMAEAILREMKMILLLVGKWQLFSGVSL